jgi:hypothetical protein
MLHFSPGPFCVNINLVFVVMSSSVLSGTALQL